jgi:signal transduction histidine kinase
MMWSWVFGATLRGVITAARRLVARIRELDPVRVDYGAAVVLLIGFELIAATTAEARARWAVAVVGLVLALALANRRRHTLAALALLTVTVAIKLALIGGTHAGGKVFVSVAALLLFYGAGAYLDGRRAWLGLALVTTCGVGVTFGRPGNGVPEALFDMVALVWMPWIVGRVRRVSGARERAARESAERLDAERELRVRTAMLGERVRLARELHDVIAHSVSVMVIQAAGARTVMDREPDRAEMSLRSVERAGREALAEMRRLLGVLGNSEELRVLAPQPGLDDLPELVSSSRAAGLDSSLQFEGQPVAVSPGLSLCAYRVVQEALTNTLKHAGPTSAEVHVRWRDDVLELKVADAGRTRPATQTGSSGHGIAGMRERAALHGGTVHAGPRPGGGFVVQATIPLLDGRV